MYIQKSSSVNNQVFSPEFQIFRIILITIFSFLLSLSLWILYYIHVRGKTKRLIETIAMMLENPKTENFADTTLSDELQLNVSLINSVIAKFRVLVKNAEKTGNDILKTTDNLSIISNQVKRLCGKLK